VSTPPDDRQDRAALLEFAKRGDADAFQRLGEPHRRELQLHCYRMLGSFHDAEDLVQETFLRAWRSVARFEGRASFRAWLYRIATNACLNALGSRLRARRVLPDAQGPPSNRIPASPPAAEIAWLEPYPDAALNAIADATATPDARYEMREAVQLAFVAAIQHLPPRQRAALLLHDVLGWPVTDIAPLLRTTVAAVNSALQRARATIEKDVHGRPPAQESAPSDEQRAILERYVQAWERADVDGFAALLSEEAVLSMPPWQDWYRGRDAIRSFFVWTGRPGGHGPFRLLPTAANGQPAFAFYRRLAQPGEWRPHSIQVLTFDGDSIASMVSFVDPSLFPLFGLPSSL
jgi:RNA polymerase sigma-70 factor (ECF subfamily)